MAKHERSADGRYQFPQFTSMKACSAATGIPMSALKEAKDAGSSAIGVSGRVDLGEFLSFYFSHLADDDNGQQSLDNMDWGERHKRAQALMTEQKLKERELETFPREVIEVRDQKAAMRARQLLEKKLTIEAPAKLANRDIDQVRAVMEHIADDVCACMADGLQMKKLMAEVRAAQDAEESDADATR